MGQEPDKVRAVRRTFAGTAVRDAVDKTVRVMIERRVKHPLYGKVMRRRRHLLAHDEGNACVAGDSVVLEECPRRSKRKSWRVVSRSRRRSS